MSGECDICGQWEHVEGSCPHRWESHLEHINSPARWAQEAAKLLLEFLDTTRHPSYQDMAKIIHGEAEWAMDELDEGQSLLTDA